MKLIFIVLLMGNLAFLASQLLVKGNAPGNARVAHQEGQTNKLQMLGERSSKGHVSGGGKQKAAEIVRSSSAQGDVGQCHLIGPFVELLHAEYLVERLTSLDVSAAVKNIEILDGVSFWVYLKPEISEKEALRKLYEVQAKAIDSYIIPSGELVNGISFGQFGSNKEATEKAEKIREQGYVAEIKEIPKNHSEVWVEIKNRDEQKISAEQWLDLLKEEKGIERRQNYCLGVAR